MRRCHEVVGAGYDDDTVVPRSVHPNRCNPGRATRNDLSDGAGGSVIYRYKLKGAIGNWADSRPPEGALRQYLGAQS